MGFQHKIRDLKTQIAEARTDINQFGARALRLAGQGEVYPVQTGEPQKSYMWEVGFVGDADVFKNARLYAKSATIPPSSVEIIEEQFLGRKMYFAGKDNSTHSATITFWDNEDMEVYRFLQEWINVIVEPQFGLGVSKQRFTRTMKLLLKDTSDLFTTADFYLKDCFPSEINEVSLSYDVSNAIEITATFYYDTKYAGKPPQPPSGQSGDSLKSYLNLDKYVSAFTGDFNEFDLSVPNIRGFF